MMDLQTMRAANEVAAATMARDSSRTAPKLALCLNRPVGGVAASCTKPDHAAPMTVAVAYRQAASLVNTVGWILFFVVAVGATFAFAIR